jgi:hypothetical protein
MWPIFVFHTNKISENNWRLFSLLPSPWWRVQVSNATRIRLCRMLTSKTVNIDDISCRLWPRQMTYPSSCQRWRHLLSRWFLVWLVFRPWRWRRCVPPKRQFIFNGLHGVISQKIVLFITTAVNTLENCYCRTGTKIRSWAPDGAWHQDWLANWSSVVTWLRFWLFKESKKWQYLCESCENLTDLAKRVTWVHAVGSYPSTETAKEKQKQI